MTHLITCAIHRLSFLHIHEKLVLHRMALSEVEFIRLGIHVLRNIGVCGMNRGEGYDPVETLELAKRDCDWLEQAGRFLIPIWDSNYPRLLQYIYDPPFALYVRASDFPSNFFNSEVFIAMVGTRKPSAQGMQRAHELSEQLGLLDIGIVSGLARGIDSSAHRGALKSEGKTIAVLGHGCDMIYPRAHTSLATDIVQCNGALLSEYPPRTTPRAYFFPQRNRIISGISSGVVSVEAPKNSGALITVDFALEQGRDVVVISDLLTSRRNAGCRALYDMGAPAVNNAREILHNIIRY